ncbi:hypothetical protein IE53DRAFT_211517 [Violaceomyces palustris]|uniref:Uncharacterized protein n=1 Tax=Violaceomyces palustris TaxID=1673888 RepID=A0ACD0NQS9_9BASI|nr:hypothetical protein IE53DRAFT_211517 [Violaceomyces palustris]
MRVACWVQLSSPRPEMAELLKAILLDPMRDFMLQMRRWQISQGFDIAEDPVYERTFGYSTYSIDLTRHGHIAPVLGGWLDSWSLKYNSSISEGESQSKARTGRSTRAQRLKGSNFHFWKVESGLDLKAFSEALNHEVLQELGKGAGQEGKDEAYSRKDEERDAGWLDLLTWYVTNWCQDAGAKRRTVECYWSASSPTRQLLILRDKTLRSALLSSKERSEILDPLLDADAFHIADVAPVDPLANWPKARMELIDDAEQLPGHVDVEDSREIKRKKLAVNGALILTKVLESLVRTGSITRSQFLLYCQLRAGTEPANFSGSVQDKLAMHLCEPGNCINFVKSSKLGGRTLEEVQEASMEPRRYGSRQWWYHLRKALKRGLISSGEIEKELLVLGKLYTEASKEENEGADAMALESATIRVSAALLRTARSATALEIAGRVLKNPDLSSWHRKLPLNPSLLTHLPVKEALLYLESVGHTIRDLAAEQERIRIREAEAREGSESEGIKLDKNPLKTSTSKAFIEFLSFSLESHLVDTKSLTKKLLEIYRTVSHHDIASAVVEKLHMMLKGCYLPSTSLTTTSQGEAGVSSLIWQALTSVAERAAEEHFSENRGVRVGSSLMFAKLAFLSHKYDPRSDPVPELSSRYLNQVIFAYIEKRIQLGERGLLRYVGRLESVGTEREARLRKAINLLSWPWELDLQLERWLIASLDSDSSRQYLTEIGFDLLKLKEGTIARQDESAFAEVASYLDEVRPSGWLQSLEAKLESYQERGGKHDAEAEPTTVPAVLMEDIRKKKSAFEANRIKERLRWNHLEYLFELYGQLIKDKYESLREATGTDQRVEQEIEANEEGVNKFRLVEQSIKNIIGVAARKPRAVEMADVDGQRGAAEGLRDFDKLSRRFNVEAIETNRFKDFTAQRLRSRIWEENHKRLLSQIKVQLEINTQAGYLLPPIRSKQAAADLAEAGSGGEEGSLSAGWGIESLRSQLRTEWYLLPWVRIVGPEGKRTGAEWKADEGDIEELAKKLLEFVHGSIVSKFERNAQAFLEVLSPVGFNQHVLVDLCRAMLDELERWKIDTGLRVRGTAKEERTKRSRRRLRMVQTVRSLEVFVHLLIKGWFEQDFKRVIERVKNPKAIEFVKGIKRDLEARMRESVAASTGRHLFADEEEEGGEQGDTEQEAEERERREEEKLNVELALIWHDVFSGVLGASPSRHESMW